jgi:hypothetical protein
MNALSHKPCINFQATVSFLSINNFQCLYPWNSCFIISWFPGINLSAAMCLPIHLLETAHVLTSGKDH